ncbi:MAG: hypothetical protein NC321_13580 [Clostridium sp.]|nr:hypothetical protein [Clostridium sp.]
MKLEYKGKKWDKEIARIQEYLKEVKGVFKNQEAKEIFKNNELVTINEFSNSKVKDYLRLYNCLSNDYERLAAHNYLNDITCHEIIKYTYFSGYAMLITKCLYEQGVRTEYNIIIENAIERKMDYSLFQLIAVDEIENPYIKSLDNNLIMLMYYQKYEQAKAILNQLPDEPDESREVYYVRPECLKKIYMAIIEHDEKSFNEELAKRIKKYRRNMVGYSTIIDIVSIALIKMAEQEGIHCTVDVIEIPKQFFDGTCKIDKDKDKLPFYDELLELKII